MVRNPESDLGMSAICSTASAFGTWSRTSMCRQTVVRATSAPSDRKVTCRGWKASPPRLVMCGKGWP
eukprot:1038801-Pyramimonas_sp.AAC.1